MIETYNPFISQAELFGKTLDLVSKIQSYVVSRKSKLIMLLIPDRNDLDSPGRSYVSAQQICSKLNLDCLSTIRSLRPEDYTDPPDQHWNVGGHRKVGYLLLNQVLKAIGRDH
jgi:hypothetical protein